MFLDTLNALMLERGLNKGSLSKQSGIPYTTIDGFYKKGYSNAKLSTLRQLAAFFNVSLDYLVGDCLNNPNICSLEDQRLLDKYRELNSEGRMKVIEYIVDLSQIPEYSQKKPTEPNYRLVANEKQSGDAIIRRKPRIT